jgi:carboxylesterase
MTDPAAPFSLGEGPDACLLLHGLTGAPSEVRPIGEALARRGFRVLGPLLPGHGTRPEDLARVSSADMLRSARSSLQSLRGARRVYLCGLSMGALLAIHLAAKPTSDDPPIAALALIAPAIRFAGTSRIFTGVLGRFPLPGFVIGKGARDLQANSGVAAADDRGPLHPDGSYRGIPLSWARGLRQLSKEGLRLAPRVRVPTLLAHGGRDTTASPVSVRLLANALGADRIELRIFPRSGHVLPLDLDGPAVSKAVVEFFQSAEA